MSITVTNSINFDIFFSGILLMNFITFDMFFLIFELSLKVFGCQTKAQSNY